MMFRKKIIKFCCICFTKARLLKKTIETDKDNLEWSKKLKFCVPEKDWNDLYICDKCLYELDITYRFRKRCLSIYDHLQNEIPNSSNKREELDGKTSKISTFVNKSKNENTSVRLLKAFPLPKLEFYFCKICLEKFKFRRDLCRHNVKVHNTHKPFNCLFCGSSFKSNLNRNLHEQKHLIKWQRRYMMLVYNARKCKKNSCPDCRQTFSSHSQLKLHIKTNHHKHKNAFTCYHCKKDFATKNLIILHLENHHRGRVLCESLVKQEKNENNPVNELDTNLKNQSTALKCSGDSECWMGDFLELNIFNNLPDFNGTKQINEANQINTVIDCNNLNQAGIVTNHYIKKEKNEARYNAVDLEKLKDEVESEKLEIITSEEQTNKTESIQKTPQIKRKKGRKKLPNPESLQCPICNITYSSKYLIKRHINNVHATEKKFKCEVCGQKFASSVYLRAHKRYHTGDRSHICITCGKGFITGSDLYHHEKIHANKRAYKCDKCPKAFNTSSDLHKHRICVHLDRTLWKYVCTYCEKRFPLKTNLDTHLKIHTGERNFACHLCDRKCINRSVLMRHIETHSNVRAFKCMVCGQEYKYQKSMDIHLKKAHGIGNAKVPQREKKFFCHMCPKSYFANNKLEKHIRTHTGERPFACNLCDKKFIDKSYVKQHLKAAHNVYNVFDIKQAEDIDK